MSPKSPEPGRSSTIACDRPAPQKTARCAGAPWTEGIKGQLAILVMLVVAGLAATAIDVPLSRTFVKEGALGWLRDSLEAFEPFGQPAAILFTAAAIALCDARRRPMVPRLLAAALGAGLAADVVKLFIIRARPHSHDLAGSVLDTFRGFWGGPGIGSNLQSFPSAHTATAVGFCLGLWTLFPAGRLLFLGAAGMVALQRLVAGAHYLSDICWGAAVGYAVSLVVFRSASLGRYFDRLERCAPPGEASVGSLAGQSSPVRRRRLASRRPGDHRIAPGSSARGDLSARDRNGD